MNETQILTAFLCFWLAVSGAVLAGALVRLEDKRRMERELDKGSSFPQTRRP